MKTFIRLVLLLSIVFLNNLGITVQAQQSSGRQYRQWAIMNGNQVQTVFGNWGVIGQPAEQGHRGAWKYPNNGYLGDVSPLVGAEVKYDSVLLNGQWVETPNSVFHEVVTCPVSRPTLLTDTDPRTGKYWTFEPENGFYNSSRQPTMVAMSNDKSSWPTTWPDKLQDTKDPGWPGSWNGYKEKKPTAELETYFVVDDNNDERFSDPSNNPKGIQFRPDATDLSRKGLGFVMKVRAMQWGTQPLAQDNIFWLYEITNTGSTNYDRAVFGMLVGTYVGCTSTDDSPAEYADDWSFFDVSTNLTYTGDIKAIKGQCMKNPLWQPTPCSGAGLVGYAFLESPGNPYDGIDNDGDADSSVTGRLAPRFTPASFDSTLLTPGKQIVLIRDDYSRYIYTIPSADSVQITTHGLTRWIYPGKTWVSEGNVQSDGTINPNAYDGIDNDYDGLIDENFFLHYEQVKKTPEGIVLFDILRPVAYVDYFTGIGSDPYSMIDERRDDGIDNNKNWDILYDDNGRDGVPNTGDYGEGDGQPTSGYDNGKDTGLPGEWHVDKTDVNESDQIGLTSFFYFAPASNFKMGDKDTMWLYLAPGYFSVPNVIQNNRPVDGADGDFIYGSGYFPLQAKKTERFSLALVYGGGKNQGYDVDVADLLKNKRTVQKIYDANYQFPLPPDLPTLKAVPGDGKVTLSWDRVAEETLDPLLHTKTFEGYKLYRSTDPTFNDIHTITDGFGSAKGYQPLKQWDLNDGIKGFFQITGQLFQDNSGWAFYLGDDSGIEHTYVDSSVQNGRTYYYSLVAYNTGNEYLELLPASNRVNNISISTQGTVYLGQNCAAVVPNAKTLDYIRPIDGVQLNHLSGVGTGDAYYKVVDETKTTGHRYRVEFLDTQVDGIDNNNNGLIDLADSTEWDRITTNYSVRDLEDQTEKFISNDTIAVSLQRKYLISGTIKVFNDQGKLMPESLYKLNNKTGQIHGLYGGSLPAGQYTIQYQYYPVYQSKYIRGTPYSTDSKDADVFDGVELVFNNPWSVAKDDSTTKWITNKTKYSFNMLLTDLYDDNGNPLMHGYRKPCDYEFQFDSTKFIDTSYADPILYSDAIPTYFRIYNKTEKTYLKFSYTTLNFIKRGRLAPKDDIFLYEKDPRGEYEYTWELFFDSEDGKVIPYHTNDTLRICTTKPFSQGDTLAFITTKPKSDPSTLTKDALSRVRVVPNPYVASSTLESPLPPSVTSGRLRRIDFIHLPASAKILIYTSRGDHVITLAQSGNIEDGHVSWNLKTKENLDVAFGVYFYVIESSIGTKTGKLAIIK